MSISISGKVFIDRYDDADILFYIMRALGDMPLVDDLPGTFQIMDRLEEYLDQSERSIFYFNDFSVHRSELKDLVFLEQMLDFYEICYRNLNGEECNPAQNMLFEEMILW